jgi:hypothetical protein
MSEGLHCRPTKILVAGESTLHTAPAIVCTRRRRPRCASCGTTRGAFVLCDSPSATVSAQGGVADLPLSGEKAGQTCSRVICQSCATHVDPDHDYCPPHARLLGSQQDIGA